MSDELPRWVEDELWNWSRWCWDGEWPGPGRHASKEPAACEFPPQPGHDEDDETTRIPANRDRALVVDAIYKTLPLIEQRIVQAEYTRRKEYGDLPAHLRQDKACRIIGIGLPYYKVALGSFKRRVWEAFE